jgi:hypothetical protein
MDLGITIIVDHLGAVPPSSPFLATVETLGELDLLLTVRSRSGGAYKIT